MKFFRVSSVFLLSVTLAACATQNTTQSVAITPKMSGWKFTQIQVKPVDSNTVITANLHTKYSKAKGFVLARAFSKEGELLANSECKRMPMHAKRRGKIHTRVSSGYLKITLPVLLQPDTKFQLGIFDNSNCSPQKS